MILSKFANTSAYNEALEDIEIFDEISNLCEGSEEEPEIDNFKHFRSKHWKI